MKKRGYQPRGFYIAVLTAWFAFVSACQFIDIQRELPDAVEWYSEEGFAFSGRELSALAADARVGVFAEAGLPVADSVLGEEARLQVRYADAEYLELSGMEPVAGGWPQDGTQAAVSEGWALERYKRLDVTGETLRVRGKEYAICGVYRTGRSWRQSLADDGRDCVCLRIADVGPPPEAETHYLYFRKEGGDFSVNRERLQDMAAELTGRRVEPDVSLDAEAAAHVFLQNLFIGLLLWLLLMYGHLRSRTRNVMQYALLACLLAAAAFYPWYVPMGYLQGENVFAFGGYAKQFIEAQRLRHRFGEAGYLGNLVYIHAWISWTVLALQGIAFAWEMMWLAVRRAKRRFGKGF